MSTTTSAGITSARGAGHTTAAVAVAAEPVHRRLYVWVQTGQAPIFLGGVDVTAVNGFEIKLGERPLLIDLPPNVALYGASGLANQVNHYLGVQEGVYA